MVYMYENGRLHNEEDIWNSDDEIFEIRKSSLEHIKWTSFGLGTGAGALGLLFIEFVYLWVRGVF